MEPEIAAPKKDRRKGDRRVRQSDKWWANPGFYFQLLAMIITLGSGLWAIAAKVENTSTAVQEMKGQLSGVSSDVRTITLANSAIIKDQEYQKKALDEHGQEIHELSVWKDTINNRLGKIEAKLDTQRR